MNIDDWVEVQQTRKTSRKPRPNPISVMQHKKNPYLVCVFRYGVPVLVSSARANVAISAKELYYRNRNHILVHDAASKLVGKSYDVYFDSDSIRLRGSNHSTWTRPLYKVKTGRPQIHSRLIKGRSYITRSGIAQMGQTPLPEEFVDGFVKIILKNPTADVRYFIDNADGKEFASKWL